MHPEICKFPSWHFYHNKLLNGCQMSSKSAPFHQTKGLGPYVFYDIIDGREVHGKNSGVRSLCNEHEADAGVELLRFFKESYPAEFLAGRIGIITPYKCQLSLLRSRFLNAFGPSSVADIEFNTVDGFQGREVDILLLSTVRAAHSSTTASEINSKSIGFVADVRRMNVALTRARLSLWILGNARTLQTNQNWAALVNDAKERNLIMMAKMPYHSMFKTDKNKCFFEISDNRVRPSKHEKVKDSGQSVTKKLVHDKDTVERKKKYVASEVSDRSKGMEKNSEDEHISLTKDMERGSSCCGMFTMLGQQVCNGGREGKDKLSINMGKTTLGKRQSKFQNSRNNLDHPVEETGGGHKASKLPVSERLNMRPGGDRSSSTEVSASSMKGCHKDRDADDQGRAPKQSKVAEISKRKQQREAVDAILYSSLISAKKDETSTKVSARKRPFPSSIAGGSSKPPKTRSVRSDQ